MDRSAALAGTRRRPADRLAARVERALRAVADSRLGIVLLVATAAANALAAALPAWRPALDSPPYLLLIGAVLLSGVAGVGVRLPAAWREWRRPTPFPVGPDAMTADVAVPGDATAARAAAVDELRRAGYRVVERGAGMRWAAAGVQRGWSRFAGIASHLALVLLVVGAAVGSAFGSEVRFSLLPGEQALLDEARPGLTDSLRLDGFDAAFGSDGRPTRLDTRVTFLRDGAPVATALVQVNRPGDFGGHLVHAWTYGPAARLRVTGLGGEPLLDGAVALDGLQAGAPATFVELPSVGLTVGVTLADPVRNQLALVLAGSSGAIDAAVLGPGEASRLGSITVRHDGLDAYVTFLSRRDPGLGLLYGGAVLLVASLAIALWLPRRRVTLRPAGGMLRLAVRAGRFDRPPAELETLAARIAARLAAPA